MRTTILAAAVAALLAGVPVHAQDAPSGAPDASASATSDAGDAGTGNPRLARARAILDGLQYQQGNIAVPGSDAHFNLGPRFRYLDKAGTRKVLEDVWGNPPDDDVLGMVVPAGMSLVDKHAWAVVVTRTDEGHVSDEDAAKTDYAKTLQEMQEATTDANAERTKAGYPALTLVGWAEPPRYDAGSKKLYWARELSFAGESEHTLNYDIRVLGRTGYISLNAVANMGDLAAVRSGMQELLPMVEYDPGKRYADFDPSHDKLAAYGLAALVAGGVAAKAGLFAKIGVALLAAKKLVIAAFVAVVAFIKKLFGGKGKSGTVN